MATTSVMAPTESSSTITVTPDLDPREWDRYVDAAPDATGYHRTGWRPVFEQVFRHRMANLAALRGGRVVGVLPIVLFRSVAFGRFAVSLPFVNYGGVVADDEAAAQALLDGAVALAETEGVKHLELRHTRRRFSQLADKQHKVSMTLALPKTAEMLWDALDRKARNQVRKAEKSGLTARSGGVELLDGFYSVFAENMRDLGTPVYPKRFFAAVLEAFPRDTQVFQVLSGEEVIASSVTCAWRHTVEVPWASSLRAHRDKSPNNLLYWAMLRHAAADGRELFDFGRSTPDEGTFHFKRQWGAVPGPMHWEYWLAGGGTLPDQSPANPKFRAAIAVWQRLPLAVANRLGPPIVRNIP